MGAGASAPRQNDASRRSNKKRVRRGPHNSITIDILSSELERAYTSVAHAKAAVRTAERNGGLSYTECVLCLEKEIDTVFLPCGHACACRTCVMKLYNHHYKEEPGRKAKKNALSCPVCRKNVGHINRIFVPRVENARKVGTRPVLPDLSATWS